VAILAALDAGFRYVFAYAFGVKRSLLHFRPFAFESSLLRATLLAFFSWLPGVLRLQSRPAAEGE